MELWNNFKRSFKLNYLNNQNSFVFKMAETTVVRTPDWYVDLLY